MKRQKRTIGSILEIPIDGKYYYGQILPFCLTVIFDFVSDTPIKDFRVLETAPVLYKITIYRQVVTCGEWLKVGKLPLREDFKIPPMKYIYDRFKNTYELYNTGTGEITPCSKEEARGLEICAVWDSNHVVDRIKGHYSGNPYILNEERIAFPENYE